MPQRCLRFHLLFVLSILIVCLAAPIARATTLRVGDGIDRPVSLNGQLEVLDDPTGELTVADVVSGSAERRFRPIPSMLTEGYQKGATWVRFRLSAPASQHPWLLQIERPLIEHVTLYAPDETGRLVKSQPGRRSAGDEITAKTYPNLFPIFVPATPTEYYLRLQSSTSITTALNLWQQEGWENHRRFDNWIIGMVVGAVGTMIAVNLIFYFWIRDTIYPLYTVTLIVSGLVAIFHMGYAPEFLVFLNPEDIHRAWGVIVCLYSIVMVAFLTRIFGFGRHSPWALRFLIAIISLNAVALVFALFGKYGDVAIYVSRLQQIAFVFIALFALYLLIARRQYQYMLPAMAFAVVITVSFVMQSQYAGINLFKVDNSLARIMALGTVIHLVLMSAAVAKRTRDAERSLDHEKDRVLALSRSAERDLSIKVAERTAELAAANESLKKEIQRRLVLEGRLRQSLSSVNNALAQQRDFVALVSHEFRAPLAVIASAAENLSLFASEKAEGVRSKAAKIRQTVTRMSTLIENVLAGERLDSDPVPLAGGAAFNLNDLLQGIRSSMDDSAAARVHFEGDGQVMVEGNRDLLEIAVQNVIQNALKYSGPTDAVTVRLSADLGVVSVDIADRGTGIAVDDRDRIFMKFFRATGQKPAGSGLGLYIAREVARQHGGDLILAQSDANGSKFRLSLPAARYPDGFTSHQRTSLDDVRNDHDTAGSV